MKVGYLGPKGTYCHEACNNYFAESKNIEKLPFKSITDTLFAVIDSQIDCAIVPIENSIYGSVFETVDMLMENEGLNINDEIILNINHYLLSNKKYKKQEIKSIYSHTQALAQCRKYLREEFPNCELKERSSTALAAEEVTQKENTACIANKACMELYDLEIIDKNIQDEGHNQTRFAVVSLKEHVKENQNKMTMLFSTSHKPGELFRVLEVFDVLKINLSKIESRPAKTKLGEYIFWVDFEGNYNDKNVQLLITIMKDVCSYSRILGSY